MKVFLTSAYPYSCENYTPQYLIESAANDAFKAHEIVNNPEDADIVIFAEGHDGADPYLFSVFRNKIYQRFKNKCFVYQDYDIVLPLVPTVSPSIELKNYNPSFTQPFPYIIQLSPNSFIRQPESSQLEKQFLFSFIGATRTHAIRKQLIAIAHDRCFLLDTLGKNSWELEGEVKAEYQQLYADVCFKSKFILCPRGIGPNSYRLYESMEIGVAPVIISDDWVPSVGPDWDRFSIRVAESDVKDIPRVLAAREHEAEEMGKLARQAWLDWFAKDKHFHYLVEACVRLHQQRKHLTPTTYLKQYARFLEPYHARNLLRFFKNQLKSRLLPARQPELA